MRIHGESLVLAKTKPGFLCFDKILSETVALRSTYEPDVAGTIIYEQGKDYIVDFDKGAIWRTDNSSIPDYSNHILYDKKDFNDRLISNYANHDYFVWVDYETQNGFDLSESTGQSGLLKRTTEKLHNSGHFKIIGYGDSIMTGAETSAEHLQFIRRYIAYLSELFPDSQIELEDAALPGHTTAEGVKQLEEKVLTHRPDLVLVAFGMNDHIKPCGNGISLANFKNNLFKIVIAIKESTSAEVILLSTFPPNPNWFFSTGRVNEYAEVTRAIAEQTATAYADVYSVWEKVLKRKDHPSLLGNNINHPNDFGHWLYLQALKSITIRRPCRNVH